MDDAQAEPEEVAVLRSCHGRLGGVDPQAQAPLDEAAQAGHDPLSGAFAAHVDVAVVGVADEPVTTPGELCVELVQHPWLDA
jgi:hypothetical protein